MKKFLSIIIGVLGWVLPAMAEHIKGGEMFYTYIGPGSVAGTSNYTITLKLYIDCSATSNGQLDASVPLTIFNKATNIQYGSTVTGNFNGESFSRFDPASNPCIGNPPTDVCYRIRVYSASVTLPDSPDGYTISFQRCCRINGIQNLAAPSNAVGATYYCEIPGSRALADAFKNSSPRFATNDATAICKESAFRLDFSAEEPDKRDSIVYMLCSGFSGGSQQSPTPQTASTPPYAALNYSSAYSGGTPLGPLVTIDAKTGLITGKAPRALGQYVITACAYEYRNGILINVHKKDIHVRVSDCVPLEAVLKPDYSFCDDLVVTFKNEQANPPGSVYTWEFGDGSAQVTSTDAFGAVVHPYADTGSYKIKLKVVLAGQCESEAVTTANVFPGFFPAFATGGTCLLLPINFSDATSATYGVANKWRWNFGDESSQADTSLVSNPSWKFSSTGIKDVQLIVESSKGCRDTITKQVEVKDRPDILLAFKDTLICSIDTLELKANGTGVFNWSTPSPSILRENTSTPLVWPTTTTNYQVTLNENGCVNTESVRVRVVDVVTLDAGPDSTICLTDTAILNPSGDGLRFSWTPTATLNNPLVKNPRATPLTTTTYSVRASIGKCFANDVVTIRTIPYPIAKAGNDTIICYGDFASIHASIVGSRFNWSPISTLSNPSVLNPVASPNRTTIYTLRAYDTLGCPKPGISDIQVTVRPQIPAFAGNDTSIVVGQPLKMNGTGAPAYNWLPATGLSNSNIADPTALINDNITYIMRGYTEEGCEAFDTISIKVFKTEPDIFVPNAFNPAGIKNPVFRPVPVGISSLDYFRVYNRWGQMVFQTVQVGKGWDGTVAGKAQDPGTYVWMVSGRDYTGKTVARRGTMVLLR